MEARLGLAVAKLTAKPKLDSSRDGNGGLAQAAYFVAESTVGHIAWQKMTVRFAPWLKLTSRLAPSAENALFWQRMTARLDFFARNQAQPSFPAITSPFLAKA